MKPSRRSGGVLPTISGVAGLRTPQVFIHFRRCPRSDSPQPDVTRAKPLRPLPPVSPRRKWHAAGRGGFCLRLESLGLRTRRQGGPQSRQGPVP